MFVNNYTIRQNNRKAITPNKTAQWKTIQQNNRP